MDFAKLSAPFPADIVSWRPGTMTKDKSKAMALAYIDARDVMQRLDDVCGPDGWQNRYTHADRKTVCEIGIRVGDEWVWKSDGAGESDIEAEKGALSDAFKRAAVRWGIGRYLYDLDSPWVKITEFKQIDPAEVPKLRALLNKGAKPAARQAVPAPEPDAPKVGKPDPAQMLAAIARYSSLEALEQWAIDNKPFTAQLDDAHYKLVLDAWKAKRLALSSQAVPA